MDTSNLELRNSQTNSVAVADIIVSDPIDDKGLKYQDVVVTIPLKFNVNPGEKLTIYDLAKDAAAFTFVAQRIMLKLEGEQFIRIDGRIFLVFPEETYEEYKKRTST